MVKKKDKQKKKSSRVTSSLSHHKQVGKSLIPPMLTVPNVAFQSWMDDRLPELLWACLVISVLPREHALSIFREIAAIGHNYRDAQEMGRWSLYHSHLPTLPTEILNQIVTSVTRHPLGYAALRPLMFFDALPGRDQWSIALKVKVQQSDWQTLGDAVLKVLDHQSQEATDVRWMSLLFKLALGVLHLPMEVFEELVEYPNKGDMRKVRPTIRSAEMAFAMETSSDNSWSKAFWRECLEKTACEPGRLVRKIQPDYDRIDLIKQIQYIYASLIDHWFNTLITTSVDAKHDSTFGFGFYGLAILTEMIVGRNGSGITGRALLRILSECRITLAYLKHIDSADLWAKFRKFGTGQAKLAFLKLDEMSENKPSFVSTSVLETLSNEDIYQEYVQIELGHWCGLDLRKMAEASGTKDEYDKFYAWTSTFVHGHWPALRDSCMTHCYNPLHRLHRIPLPGHRLLEDAVPDGVQLVNLILNDVTALYPGFISRVKLVFSNK